MQGFLPGPLPVRTAGRGAENPRKANLFSAPVDLGCLEARGIASVLAQVLPRVAPAAALEPGPLSPEVLIFRQAEHLRGSRKRGRVDLPTRDLEVNRETRDPASGVELRIEITREAKDLGRDHSDQLLQEGREREARFANLSTGLAPGGAIELGLAELLAERSTVLVRDLRQSRPADRQVSTRRGNNRLGRCIGPATSGRQSQHPMVERSRKPGRPAFPTGGGGARGPRATPRRTRRW
jgi:hypothetical protein